MGIINATPDSFSDGGLHFEHTAAIDRGLELAANGADLLDIGGESTRPYSLGIDAAEELRRVLPVVQGLRRQTPVPLSIDTSKALVAQAALDEGVEIINDVTGLAGDPEIIPLALRSSAAVCVMHMQGTPQTMQDNPQYDDVVTDILQYLRLRRDALTSVGIETAKICLDPGIGFGKTHEHNVQLLAACHRFHELSCPLLVGPSRKGFIGKILGDKSAPRDAATAGIACALASQGVQIIRVHDVGTVRQALLLYEASGGMKDEG